MATIQLKFGSLALDSTNNITISGISEKSQKAVNAVNIPVTDGAIAETARLGAKQITIQGDIAGTSYDNLTVNLDALHAGLLNGMQKLTKDNERYIYCQLKDFSYSYEHMTRFAKWTATFIAHYPFWLAETASTSDTAPTSGTGYVIANAGNAPTRVKIVITANGEIDDDCQFENTTLGQTLKYRGTVAAGDDLEIDNRHDTDDFQVLNDGVSDMTNFEGDFITLQPGNNTVEYTGTAITKALLTWRSCWY